jgi:DNA-binding beta-propeller fold protein YncE
MVGRSGGGCLLGVVLVVALAAAMPAGVAWAAGGNAYVADSGDGVSQYDIGASGLLAPKTPASVTAGARPFGIAVSPDGKSVYVVDNMSASVSQFDVGAAGMLSPKTPASVAAGSNPAGVAVSPDGKSVYVTNFNSNSVSQYDVSVGGALSPKSPATVGAGLGPQGVAVSPDGKSVYVADVGTGGTGTVSQYDVGAGGALSPKLPATIVAGISPVEVAVTPDGRSVYVVNFGSGGGTVSEFDVGSDGALSPKSTPAVAAGLGAESVAVSPDGKSAYVANFGDNTVSQYDIGAGELLSPKTPATVASVSHPAWVAVTPDGKSVYAVNNGTDNVSQWNVGPSGLLSAKTPTTVGTGLNASPEAIAVLPDQGPVAAFSAVPAAAGSASRFDGSGSSDSDGIVVRYDWSFGDGSTASNDGVTPSHVYARAGTYTARLTVTDDAACSTTFVFTGQTAYCNGTDLGSTTRTVVVPPVGLSGLGVSPKRFLLSGRVFKGRCVKPSETNSAAKRCQLAIKLKISYKLSGAAAVTFTLKRNAAGRKVAGRCVKSTTKNKHKPKCTRLVTIHGQIVTTGKTGANSFTFNGKLGGEQLFPGTYQLTGTPTGGMPQTTTLKIRG